MSRFRATTMLDKVFEGGILLKGLSGLAEFVGGLLALVVNPGSLHSFLALLTQREIAEDPADTLANAILHSADHFNAGNQTFVVAYLWIHAAIKLTAAFGLLRNQLWAYPFSLISIGGLVVYQLYSLAVNFSLGMLFLTVFDLAILALISREYSKAKAAAGSPPA